MTGPELTRRMQTVEYHAYSLLTNYATDAQTKAWVDQYDFYIFPVVNPDGKSLSQPITRYTAPKGASGLCC